ncbi:hypothetical protein [Kribbella sp. DT2]|uniref:hypothetical protein n=1 Tax=Kribbella sp. DT2 TaxID=3393427 RepID=UPI003CFAC07D
MDQTKLVVAVAGGMLLALTACRGAEIADTTPTQASPSRAVIAGRDADVAVTVRIAGGVVEPVALPVYASTGQVVRIDVVSDARDSVHVHGYDQSVDVTPGSPAQLVFTADVVGAFDIETHQNKQLVARLVVSGRH